MADAAGLQGGECSSDVTMGGVDGVALGVEGQRTTLAVPPLTVVGHLRHEQQRLALGPGR